MGRARRAGGSEYPNNYYNLKEEKKAKRSTSGKDEKGSSHALDSRLHKIYTKVVAAKTAAQQRAGVFEPYTSSFAVSRR